MLCSALRAVTYRRASCSRRERWGRWRSGRPPSRGWPRASRRLLGGQWGAGGQLAGGSLTAHKGGGEGAAGDGGGGRAPGGGDGRALDKHGASNWGGVERWAWAVGGSWRALR